MTMCDERFAGTCTARRKGLHQRFGYVTGQCWHEVPQISACGSTCWPRRLVVAIVHGYVDQHRTGHVHGLSQGRREILRALDGEAAGTHGFREADGIDRAELHTRTASVFHLLLEPDHVIEPVAPDDVDEVALQPHRGLQFDRGEVEPAVSGNGNHLFAGPDQAGGNRPRQGHAKRLLAVADDHLPRSKHLQIAGNPDVERSHIEAKRHVVRDDGLQVGDQPQRMDRHTRFLCALFSDHRHLVDHRAEHRIRPSRANATAAQANPSVSAMSPMISIAGL